MARYKCLLFKRGMGLSVYWACSWNCWIGDFSWVVLANTRPICTEIGLDRLYVHATGFISSWPIGPNVRLCGLVLGLLDLVGSWLLCGEMSGNGMVVFTHDQDVNRLVVLRFWYDYS